MGYTSGFRWDEKAIERLNRLLKLGLTRKEITREMGVTYDSLDGAIKRYGLSLKIQHDKLEVPDGLEFPSAEKLINYLQKGHELIREFDPRQREVFPEYNTKKWIGIVAGGDWHFDHYKTDLRALREDLKNIGEQEEVFYIHNGDVGDWGDIRFKFLNMPSVYLPIKQRYELILHLVSQIKNLLAITAGCHDDWLKNRGFYDIVEEIKKKQNELGIPTYYLGYGGTINFKVGKATYRIASYHKFGYESQNNDFNPNQNYLKKQDATADIVVVSHRHDKVGISYQYYQHTPRIFVRTGSHQYLTDYAWKEGFSGAIARWPMILLNGKEKRMLAMPDYKEGLEELRRLNRE